MFLYAASKFQFFLYQKSKCVCNNCKTTRLRGVSFKLPLCVVKGFLFNWRSSIFNEVSINWCAQRRTWEASVFVLDVVCCYSCCSNIQRLFTCPHPPPPWCITFQCIRCSVRTLQLDKLYIANQLKNVAIIMAQLEENG